MRLECIYLFCFLHVVTVHGQTGEADPNALARELIANGRFEEALTNLPYKGKEAADEEVAFMAGVCLYQLNKLNEAAAVLTQLVEKGKRPVPETWFYAGKTFHARHEFDKAVTYYKTFLKLAASNSAGRKLAIDEIKRCGFGLSVQFRPSLAFVENLGQAVNSKFDEIAPIPSPTQPDRLYFSAARKESAGGLRDAYGRPDEPLGQYAYDMFTCHRTAAGWTGLQPMHYLVNSMQNEILQDFGGPTGEVMYYFQGRKPDQGALLVDSFQLDNQRTFQHTPVEVPYTLQGAGFPSVFFFNDTTILFSAILTGGFGGYDLYRSTKTHNRWSAPQNLGPAINTSYDEVNPFLARDGVTLYFSSNNSCCSMGGQDVFKSIYLREEGLWSEPLNLGPPVNSAADDVFFRLAKDGFSAFFASSRKDGYGQRDLYIAYFREYLDEMDPPVIPMAATPTKQERPPVITGKSTTSRAFTFHFDNKEQLTQENNHPTLEKILEELTRTDQKLVITCVSKEATSVERQLFVGILSAVFLADYFIQRGAAADRIFLRAVGSGNPAVASNKTLTCHFSNLQELPGLAADIAQQWDNAWLAEPYFYKIQIASLKSEYKGGMFEKFDHAMVETTPGFSYYRYTVGMADRYAEAEALRQEIAAAGQPKAFVVPYIHGLRSNTAEAKQHLELYPDLSNYLDRGNK